MHSKLGNTDRHILIVCAALFVLRMFHITEPPIEVSHNWRQTTSLMVARNFYQENPNIFYPSLDENGEKPGYVAMEFPLLSYSIFLVSELFGYDHWYGRLINLLIVSVGSWYFYRILKLYFSNAHAFLATVAYSCSSLFHLARKVLPDPMSLSLVIIGVYYGMMYLREGKWKNLLLYFIFATAGTLVKIPFGLYLVVLAIPFFRQENKLLVRFSFVIATGFLLLLVYYWYFIWNPHLAEISGIWYNSGRQIGQGWQELQENIGDVLQRFYFSTFQGVVLFAYTIFGLGISIYRKELKPVVPLLICLPLIIVYMLKSGFLFAHHGYYALILLPVFAVLAGYFLTQFSGKWLYILLLAGVAESIANQQHDFFVKEKDRGKLELQHIADQLGPRTDLVALVSNQNPNEFYFLNRKGWMIEFKDLNMDFLTRLKQRGCRYIFIKQDTPHEQIQLHPVFENHEYIVFQL